jgi:hypothetical protein
MSQCEPSVGVPPTTLKRPCKREAQRLKLHHLHRKSATDHTHFPAHLCDLTLERSPIFKYVYFLSPPGHCSEPDQSISEVWQSASSHSIPGVWTHTFRFRWILGMRSTYSNHNLATPGGYVQDGTWLRSWRCGRPATACSRDWRPSRRRRFHHASDPRQSHDGACLYDWWKGSRHDKIDMEEKCLGLETEALLYVSEYAVMC